MEVELGQLVNIQIGYQIKGKVVSQPEDTHLLVQTGDVNENGEISWESLDSLTPDRKETERYTLTDGDVLYLSKGFKRVAAVVRNPRPKALAVSTFYILRIRDSLVLPEYLVWFLNVAAVRELTAGVVQGVTIPFITKEVLTKLQVTLLPMGTQKKIVALYELMRRERRLTSELMEKRTILVDALTKRLIKKEDER